MIEWSKLKPYQNDQRRSFEELCYQIAKGLHGESGRFTSVDDRGGGDGVEFYLTFPNGEEWGWQAKFYHPQPRLRESGRKRSITNSLKKACEKHPNLKKWVLCTPTNFTPEEQTWFDNTLPQSIPESRHIELEHWGNSEFNAWLSEPRFAGKRNYFFGELELDMDWFQEQCDKQMAAVGEKFDASLHTETHVDAEIHALLGDAAFVRQITKWIEKLEAELPDLEEEIENIKSPMPNEVERDKEGKVKVIGAIEWDEEEKLKVIRAAESLRDALVDMIDKFEHARKLLDTQKLTEAQAIDWKAEDCQLRKVFDSYREVTRESGISQIKYSGKKEYEERFLDKARWVVDGPDRLVAVLLAKFFPSVIWKLGLINESDLHILGDAGIGKTHIACNICNDRLESRLPALFLRGSRFTTDRPIEEQLRNLLDIPSVYSWNDFLQALSAAAEAYHTRIPLIIDGLNESVHNGTFSKVWELGLKGLVQEITETKNVVLITTCRESYKDAIWKEVSLKDHIPGKMILKDKDSLNLVYASGFATEEVRQEAIDKYFKAYKIKADLTLAPLEQFEHPIYLKIFCETNNRECKTEVQVYVGEQTLFEIFEEYLKQCNRKVCDRLDLRPGTCIVQPALNKIAEHLWQNRSREIPPEDLAHIVDGQSCEELKWSSSKTRAIESEGLLVYREWVEVGEVMNFTYDLLGGYLIAKYLVENAADVQGFLNDEETVTLLFGDDHQALHPMHEDICRCLAALLPAKTGHFLHEFSDNKRMFGLSIGALFEISPKYINQGCTNLIAHLFDQYQENRDYFFRLAETTIGHPSHPFNASFWSDRLMALSMSERDLSWTEYVRNRYSFEDTLIGFEETCQNDENLSEFSVKRLHLYAEHIMWILTSTVRPLRDQATRALYWYGRRFPQEFFDLVLKAFTINDPYVSERMLAATYGIAMARQHDFKDPSFVTDILPAYGRQLYEAMFKPDAPHSTTHILARDYAKQTIDVALIHHPNLLTEDERERITPPFTDGGIREWGESERNADGYGTPLKRDFRNYTLGSLVKERHNYDFEHEEYKRVVANILWRIDDLEYSSENFVEIDKRIAQENEMSGRSADRYGKKYSWIAFYELAGFRQDKDLLPDYDDARALGADIDPSFPVEQREYNLVTEDLLGNRKISAAEWVSKSSPPDLTPYLRVDCLCGDQGPWVLLKGSLRQKDDHATRDMLTFLHGLIVKSEEADKIVEILKDPEKISGHTLRSCPQDDYTYAGEIPWCETYPKNSWEEVRLKVGSVSVPEERPVLLRNDTPISDEEWHEFLESISDLIEPENSYASLLGFRRVDSIADLWQFEQTIDVNASAFGTVDNIADLIQRANWETIKTRLHEQGFELKTEMVEVENPEYQTFEMLVPVRQNCWEDSKSAAVPKRNVAIPMRQLAEAFGLCGQPQSFDLFEENGRRASITFCYGEEWVDRQDFTYLRQDLLERYLSAINGELIWVIWGEQSVFPRNENDPFKLFHDVKVYRQL